MYSREFMKFLFSYQKDDFKQQEPEPKKIELKSGRKDKLAKVYVYNEKV